MKTKEEIKKEAEERFWKLNGKDFMDNEITHLEKSEYVSGYLSGYNQCQEDNTDKKYSDEDLRFAISEAQESWVGFPSHGSLEDSEVKFVYTTDEIIESLNDKKRNENS